MWCKNCNIETNEEFCPICNTKTIEDIPNEVYWCSNCNIPVIQDINKIDKGICPICGKTMKYLSFLLTAQKPKSKLQKWLKSANTKEIHYSQKIIFIYKILKAEKT